jgi:hypothetical protein
MAIVFSRKVRRNGMRVTLGVMRKKAGTLLMRLRSTSTFWLNKFVFPGRHADVDG